VWGAAPMGCSSNGCKHVCKYVCACMSVNKCVNVYGTCVNEGECVRVSLSV